MKKNNNCKKIIICFILSITISFFIEVFGFNYNSIFYKSYNEKAVISKIENSKLENNCFNVDNDYTKLDIKTNKDYINKISFDYKQKMVLPMLLMPKIIKDYIIHQNYLIRQ